MDDNKKTKAQLIQELHELRQQATQWQESDKRREPLAEAPSDSGLASSSLEETLRRQNEYLAALHETTLGLVSRLDLTDLLEAIVTRAGQLVGTSHGYIYLVGSGENEIEVKVGVGVFGEYIGYRMKIGEGLAGHVWQTGQPLVIQDYDAWPGRSPGYPRNVFRAAMAVPLKSGSQVVGVIGMGHVEPGRTFGDDEVAMLNRFAQLASVALDNARLYTTVQMRVQELDCLNSIGRKMAETPPVPEFLQWLAERVPTAMQHSDVCVAAVEFEGQVYGAAQALELPCQIVGSLRAGGQSVGRVCVAYKEKRDWLDEESALLGDIVRRVSGLIENHRLFEQTQAALREANTFRQFAEASGQGLGWVTLEGNVLYMNPTLLRLVGDARVQDAMGKSIAAYYSGQMLQYVQEQVLPTVMREGQWVGELPITSRDGKTTPTIQTLFLIRDENGSPRYLASVFTDIAEHKQAGAERERLLADAEKRAIQLRTAAEVSHAASSILDPDELLFRAVELICERFGLHYVGIFLVDESGQWAVLRAGTGEAGRKMLQAGHKLQVGGASMIGWCVANRQARIALDVGAEAVRFDNPALPLTRSEMALPLISWGRVIGAMTIQSTQPAAYSPEDITILQTMSDQLANAIGNAHLFQRVQDTLAETEMLYEASRRLASAGDLQEIVAAVVEGLGATAVNRAVLWSLETDAAGQPEAFIALANWHSGEGTPPLPLGTRFPTAQFPAARLVLFADPVFFDDVQSDERVDPATKAMFQRQNARAVALLPLWVGARQLGTLMLMADVPHRFAESEVRPYSALARQMAVAVEHRRMFEETRQRVTQLSILNEIGQSLSSALNLEELLEAMHRQVSRVFDTTNFYVATYTEGSADWTWAFQVEHGQRQPVTRHELGVGLTSHIIRTRKLVLMHNTEEITAFVQEHNIPRLGEMAKSWMGVPLMAAGKIVGVMAVQSYEQENLYDDQDLALFSTIAAQAATAIENARLFQDATSRLAQLTTLQETAKAVASTLELDQLLQLITQQATTLLQGNGGITNLVDWEKQEDEVVAAYGSQALALGLRNSLEGGLSGWAALHNQPVISNRLQDDNRADMRFRSGTVPGHNAAIVPLTIRDQVMGTLVVMDKQGDFDQADLDFLTAIANQAATAIQNARLFQDARNRLTQLTALQETAKAVASTLELDKLLHLITQQATALLQGDGGILNLVDWEKREDEVVACTGAAVNALGDRSPLEGSLSGWVTLHNQPAISNQLQHDSRADLGASSWQSAAIAPLSIKDQVVGTLVVLDKQGGKGKFDQADSDFLAAFANQAATAIQNARLFQDTQARARRERILREITARVRGSTVPDAIARAAVRELGDALGRPVFIRLGSAEQLSQAPPDDGDSTAPEGGE